MTLTKTSLLLLACFNLMAPTARAQPAEGGFQANVRFYNPVSDTSRLYFWSDGRDQEIRATFNGPSARYRYEGDTSRLLLYRLSGSGENIQRTPVGSVTLPASGGDYLVFLIPADASGSKFSTHILTDDMRSFPPSNTRVCNLSGSSVALQVGEARLVVPPGSIRMINNREAHLPMTGEGGALPKGGLDTHVRAGINKDGDWTVFYRAIWYLSEQARHTIFILSQGDDRLRLLQITD
jgi:hypothetical protein